MKTEMDKDFSIRMGGASICSKDRAENRRLQILQSDIQADLDIEELEDKSGISFWSETQKSGFAEVTNDEKRKKPGSKCDPSDRRI